MIKAVRFQNYKVLRDTTLPLGSFTLLIGPNGSGKSTAISALRQAVLLSPQAPASQLASAGAKHQDVSVVLELGPPYDGIQVQARWGPSGPYGLGIGGPGASPQRAQAIQAELVRTRVYSLDPGQLAAPVQPQPNMELGERGEGLAGVLDRLRDQQPERFESMNSEVARWLPEFDRVLFDTTGPGQKTIFLRTRRGQHSIPAWDLSQGTLLALGILTLAYLPEPPPIVGFEEPDRGLHPRLLRDVRDALYRLAYPNDYRESRSPVQVIATTHSPYMLDLFRDHLEDIVIAEKKGNEAKFEPLAKRRDIEQILHDAHLGDAWYTGVLGGVPAEE
jgi:predicted ATPase